MRHDTPIHDPGSGERREEKEGDVYPMAEERGSEMSDDQALAGIAMVGLFALFTVVAQSEDRTPEPGNPPGTWLIVWILSCVPVVWWLA